VFGKIIENDQREDISALDRAYSYLRLKDELGYDVAEIARRVGKSDVTIYQYLSLCKLPDNAKRALEEGTLSPFAAIRIARLATEDMMVQAAGYDPIAYDGRRHCPASSSNKPGRTVDACSQPVC